MGDQSNSYITPSELDALGNYAEELKRTMDQSTEYADRLAKEAGKAVGEACLTPKELDKIADRLGDEGVKGVRDSVDELGGAIENITGEAVEESQACPAAPGGSQLKQEHTR